MRATQFSEDTAYDALLALVSARTGLTFPPSRRREAEASLRRAMRRAKLSTPAELLIRLSADSQELDVVVAELAVGETYFFRDSAQFDIVRQKVLPELRRVREPDAIFRFWSSGCATGEEAYSLAILLEQEGLADQSSILATDISRDALAKAEKAVYGAWSLRSDDGALAASYFHRKGERFALADHIRRRVRFERLNLVLDDYPSVTNGTAEMDLILCRNVLIYFDQDTVERIVRRLQECLAQGGWLILGPSDPIPPQCISVDPIVTPAGIVYRRRMADWSRPASTQRAPGRDPVAAVVFSAPDKVSSEPYEPIRDLAGETHHAFAAGDYARVITLASKCVADPGIRILQIRSLANLGNLAEAEIIASSARRAHPLNAELHYLHGVLLFGLERLDEAAAAIRRALYLDSGLIVGHMILGAILARRNDVEGARRAYRNALDLSSARPPDEILPLSEGEQAGRLAEAARAQLSLLDGMRR